MPKRKKTSRANGKKTPPNSRRQRRARRAADPEHPSLGSVRVRTAAEIADEQTVYQLALRIWAALVGEKTLSTMSGLVDELLGAPLLDDDDEETEERLDEQHKREKKLLDETIADGLDNYPDINAINNLPRPADPDLVRAAEQLSDVLWKCAVGATKFKEKFSRAQLEGMVKRDVKARLEKDDKYSKHVRADVPGSDIIRYGKHGCTTSRGTFVKAIDYEDGGGLDALLTGGWMRVAKDRIDPVAWSYQFGFPRKSERQQWRHHYIITERSGKVSKFELQREWLHGTQWYRALLRSGVHVIRRKAAIRALARFLGFRPNKEIVRMPRVGWAQVERFWIFVRPNDEVLVPPGMLPTTNYQLDATATRHGLHITGTAAAWATEIAKPLAGNSNVALALGTFFAAPLLSFASEPGGGFHEFGRSNIGKSLASAIGQSIYGWPFDTGPRDTFGVSWGGSEAGNDAVALERTDLGLSLDDIKLTDPRTAEQVIYKIASGTKGPRATSAGQLRETAHASLLVLSTGEKSLPEFIGKDLNEGARKRLVDVPAQVQADSAFETIPPEKIHIEGARLFDAMKRQHGAVGRDWQDHLVKLGPDTIKKHLKN